jgi:uncharacterized protein (TIGR03067 family)
MRLPCFRLRTLLVAVALAALICGGLALQRRRATFLARAQAQAVDLRRWTTFAGAASSIARMFRDMEVQSRESPNNPELREEILEGLRYYEASDDEDRRRIAYHAALKARYERAARYPWLIVPPDPPPPCRPAPRESAAPVPPAVADEAPDLPQPEAPSDGPKAEGAAALEGTWAAVSYIGQGEPGTFRDGGYFPTTAGIKTGRLILRRNDEPIYDRDHFCREEFRDGSLRTESSWTTYRVNTGRDPKAIDFVLKVPEPQSKEIVYRGVYELEGDTLRICYSLDLNGPRPTEFSAPQGSKRVLAVWRRVRAARDRKPRP